MHFIHAYFTENEMNKFPVQNKSHECKQWMFKAFEKGIVFI